MECKSYWHPKFFFAFLSFVGNFLKPRLGGIKVNLSQLIIDSFQRLLKRKFMEIKNIRLKPEVNS